MYSCRCRNTVFKALLTDNTIPTGEKRHPKQPRARGEGSLDYFLCYPRGVVIRFHPNVYAALSHSVFVLAHSVDYSRSQPGDHMDTGFDRRKKKSCRAARGNIGPGHCLDGLGFFCADEGFVYQLLG